MSATGLCIYHIVDIAILQSEWQSEFAQSADLLVDRLTTQVCQDMALVYNSQTERMSFVYRKPKATRRFCARAVQIYHALGYQMRLDGWNRAKSICRV